MTAEEHAEYRWIISGGRMWTVHQLKSSVLKYIDVLAE